MRNNGSKKTEQLPCSDDAEKGLVCSLLLGGDAVAVELNVPREAFYNPANQLVWDTARDLLIEKRALDFRVVKHRLDRLDQLEEAGGAEYLDHLFSFVPAASNAKYYSQIVLEKWWLRNAVLTLRGLLGKLQAEVDPFESLRNEVESTLVAIIQNRAQEHEPTTKEITMEWYDELSTRKERLARDGIGFGLAGLDHRLGWQQPGELVVIAAKTSGGKSMLAYQGAAYNARTRKLPVGLISLEMTPTQTWDRLASHTEQISMERFREGDFGDKEGGESGEAVRARLQRFYESMASDTPFYFRSGRLDIEGIKSWARRERMRHDIRLLVVDYLQRVGVPRALYRASRQEQVSFISNELKDLALELGIVIWCPVQLNKEGDVRESMAIEFDADISIHIDLSGKARADGNILFQKVRQAAARVDPLPIRVKGWLQTVEERKADDDA